MQHTLVELERTPDSPAALPQDVTIGNEPVTHSRYLRLYFCILRSALLLALTCAFFSYGAKIIRQNAKALGFFALNFNVPLPFLLIGLWSIGVLTLTIISIAALNKLYSQFNQLRTRPLPTGH